MGTRIEKTELVALKALDLIKAEFGEKNVKITTAFIGVQPASYPINTIYLWTSGPHEAVMNIALKPDSSISLRDLDWPERAPVPAPATMASRQDGQRPPKHLIPNASA